MTKFITELIAISAGASLLGINFYMWILSGNIFKATAGLIGLILVGSGVFLIVKRGIQECIAEYRDKKKGG